LLALYDGAIERLDRAEAAVRSNDRTTAIPLLARVQLIVAELAAGVRQDVNPQTGPNMLRLYQFVTGELRSPRVIAIANARKVLRTLREGFEAIRPEAAAMERAGCFHAAEKLQMVDATA
jgi:flagellin-specific chaperone FliS